MSGLIRNEWIKSRYNIRILITALFLIGSVAIYMLIFNRISEQQIGYLYSDDFWKSHLQSELDEINTTEKNGYADPDTEIEYTRKRKAIEYRLENNISDMDWRAVVLEAYKYSADETEADYYWNIVISKDWESYVRIAVLNDETRDMRLKYGIPLINYENDSSDWKHRLMAEYENAISILEDDSHDDTISERMRLYYTNRCSEIKYRLDHDMPDATYGEYSYFLANSSYLMIVVGIAVILAAIGSIAVERKMRTRDLIFTIPHSRNKIWFSKFIALCIYSAITILILVLILLAAGRMMYGGGLIYMIAGWNTKLFAVPIIPYLIINFFLKLTEIMIYSILAICLTQISERTEIISTVIIIAYVIMTEGLIHMADYFKLDFMGYIPFTWFDLSQFWNGVLKYDNVRLIPAVAGTFAVTALIMFAAVRNFTVNKDK